MPLCSLPLPGLRFAIQTSPRLQAVIPEPPRLGNSFLGLRRPNAQDQPELALIGWIICVARVVMSSDLLGCCSTVLDPRLRDILMKQLLTYPLYHAGKALFGFSSFGQPIEGSGDKSDDGVLIGCI